jgi:hypothetical protein
MLTFKKNGTVVSLEEGLKASRIVNSKLLTISTRMPLTVAEFASRANNLVELSDEDFELLQDINGDELEGLEFE